MTGTKANYVTIYDPSGRLRKRLRKIAYERDQPMSELARQLLISALDALEGN